MNKILIAEPVYQAIPPSVYSNRLAFWRKSWAEQYTEEPNELDMDSMVLGSTWHTTKNYGLASMVIGPRNGIRLARDRAIREALRLKSTHLLFLDDDIVVPPDILAKLLEVDKPIVGGLIHRDNGDPLVFRVFSPGEDIGAIQSYVGYGIEEVVWRNHPTSGAFECAAVAAGCMLIKAEVLEGMSDARWMFNYDETPSSMDVRFSREARKHGFTVWCWPDKPCVQIKHYG